MEAEMIVKGVVPQIVRENWAERSKHWLHGHGGTMDKETRVLD